MRIEVHDGLPIIDNQRVRVRNTGVGVFQGSIQISTKDWDNVVEICQKVWQVVNQGVNWNGLRGLLVRFDLVTNRDRHGNVAVEVIFEINGEAPECAAAGAILTKYYQEISSASAASLMYPHFVGSFETDDIIFVPGNTEMKRSWTEVYVDSLCKAGFQVQVMTEEETMQDRSNRVVYRWGDQVTQHFSPKFITWMRDQPQGRVFNPTFSGVSPFRKDQLLALQGTKLAYLVGGREVTFPLEINSVDKVLRLQQRLVLKLNNGYSGVGVAIGARETREGWINKVRQALMSGDPYTLWEMRTLPRVTVGDSHFAMDFNLAFWAKGPRGEDIDPLYGIVRLMPWQEYVRKRVINVAQGGAFSHLFVCE